MRILRTASAGCNSEYTVMSADRLPGLQSASLSAKLLRELGGESVMGPYILGLEHPVQIAPMTASASDLVMLAVLAAGDAHARQHRQAARA